MKCIYIYINCYIMFIYKYTSYMSFLKMQIYWFVYLIVMHLFIYSLTFLLIYSLIDLSIHFSIIYWFIYQSIYLCIYLFVYSFICACMLYGINIPLWIPWPSRTRQSIVQNGRTSKNLYRIMIMATFCLSIKSRAMVQHKPKPHYRIMIPSHFFEFKNARRSNKFRYAPLILHTYRLSPPCHHDAS